MSVEPAFVSVQRRANGSKDSNCNRGPAVVVEPSKRTTFTQREYTIFNVLCAVWSLGSFLVDVGTDIWVAYQHYNNSKYLYFGLTLTFILVPAATISCFSLRWYSLHLEQQGKKLSKLRWCMRTAFHLLLLGQVVRYVDALIYGLKSTRSKSRQREFYQRSMQEDADASILRLFECFMEAIPQLILQMCIINRRYPTKKASWTVVAQGVSMAVSLVSAAWSLTAYNKSLRLAMEDEPNQHEFKAFNPWVVHVVELWARVGALSAFAYVFPLYMCLVCSLRWLLMSAWIISIKTPFYENRVDEVFQKLVLGMVFIFCYLDPVGTPTYFRLAAFSVVTFVENGVWLGIFWAYGPVLVWYERVIAMIPNVLYPIVIVQMER